MASAQNSKDSAQAASTKGGDDWNKAKDSAITGVEHAKGSFEGSYDSAKNNGQGLAQSAKEKLGQIFGSTKGADQNTVDSSKDKVQQGNDAAENGAKRYADNVGQKVDQTTAVAKDKVQGATVAAKQKLSRTSNDAKGAAESTVDETKEKMNNLKISSEDGANDQKGILQTIGDTITQSAMSVKNVIVGKTEQADANRKGDEDAIAEKVRKGGKQVGDKADAAAEVVQNKGLLAAAGEQLMQTSEVMGNQIVGSAQAAKESLFGTADRKQDHSVPVRQRAAEEASATKDTVMQTGEEKKEQGKGVLQAVKESLMGTPNQKQGYSGPDRQRAAEKGDAAKDTVMQTLEEKKEQGKGFMQSVTDALPPEHSGTDRKIDHSTAADSGKHVGKGMV